MTRKAFHRKLLGCQEPAFSPMVSLLGPRQELPVFQSPPFLAFGTSPTGFSASFAVLWALNRPEADEIEQRARTTWAGELVVGRDLDRFVLTSDGVSTRRFDMAKGGYPS